MEQSRITGGLGGAGQGAAIGTQISPGFGTAVGAAIGGVAGFLGGGGEDDAERLAEEQAKLITQAGEFNRQQSLKETNQVLGATTAQVAANNLLMSGSSKRFRQAQEDEYRKMMSWEHFRAKKEAEHVREGGAAAAGAIRAGGISSMLQGFGAAASAFGPFSSGMSDAQVDSALGAEQFSFT